MIDLLVSAGDVKEVETEEKLADPVEVEADVDLDEFDSEDEDVGPALRDDPLPGLRKRFKSTRFKN